ncbi:MAG: cadherin-like beta sandwich domain-containing protein [Longibaculum sp.]
MKKIRNIVVAILLMNLLLISNIVNTYAVSFGVSAKNNGNGTVTVTVTGKVVGGFNVSVGSASGQIAKQQLDQSASTTLKTGVGTFTVKVTGISVSDADYNVSENVVVEKTVTVTDKNTSNSTPSGSGSSSNSNSNNSSSGGATPTTPTTPDNRSKENSLSSLSINEGELSPKFSSSTTKYSVNLSGDKTKITINAKAKDSKAKVSGTGEKSLKVGKNEFVIKCTAENGSVKSYTLIVNVDEKPLVYTELNGEKLGVVRNLDGVNGPNKSFEETKVTIDGNEVVAWKSNQIGKTVVYLINDKNEKNYFLYEDGKITSSFTPVSFAGINLFIVDIPKDKQSIDGMKFQELTIEKQKIQGWVFENEKLDNYEMIYVMQENGTMAYYLHEKTLNTFMFYSEEFFKPSKQLDELEKSIDNSVLMRNIFIGTTAVFAITTASLAYLYFSFKKKSISAIKDYYDRKNQD